MITILVGSNLFNSVPESFFQPLCGKNKKFYADCLIELHEQYQITDTSDFDRQHVYAIIETCIEQFQESLMDDECEDTNSLSPYEESVDSSCPIIRPLTKERAYYKLRNCGWIEDDIDERRTQIVSFTIPASTLIPALKKMAQPTKISLGGYTRSIIQDLEAVCSARHPYQDAFRLAIDSTYTFMQEMSKISQEIKGDISSIMECQDFHEMLAMLENYLDKNIDGDYYKLQFSENLTYGDRRKITDLLIQIESDQEVYQKLVSGVKEHYSLDTDDEAEFYLSKSIEMIRSRLCDDYVRKSEEIQRTQARYISSANTKVSLLNTDKRNISSAINRIVLALSNISDEEYENSDIEWLDTLNNSLLLPSMTFLQDKESLYKAKSAASSRSDTVDVIPVCEKLPLTRDDFAHLRNQYSAEKVNKLIKNLIGDKTSLEAGDFPLSSKTDFYDIVSVVLYGGYSQLHYHVNIRSNRIKKNGYVFQDFVVTVKKAKEVNT